MERRHYCTVQGRAISIVLSINAYASMLQGCAKMEALPEGKNLHAHIIKIEYVFDKISGRDVVSWTAIISEYVQNGIFA